MANAFLVGPRVLLRPMEETDAEIYAGWINNPEMRNYLAIRLPISLKGEKEWIAGMTAKGAPTQIALAIERRSDGRLLGTVGLHQIDWISRRASTGSFIGTASLRGKGYGTEAKRLLIDYAFGELGLRSLWAVAVEGNVGSIRSLEKQGYARNGVFRGASLVKGVWRNLIYYDLLHEDWERTRALRIGSGRTRPATKRKARSR